MKGQKNQPFVAPAGVERLTICRSNGLIATGGGTDGTYQEYFIRTAAPSGTCNVPKPPEDTDKDGVIDANDKCADTPSGTEVDETGCEVEVDPLLDTDKDGVIDTLDKCANTPTGATVDATGCTVATNGNTGTPAQTRGNTSN